MSSHAEPAPGTGSRRRRLPGIAAVAAFLLALILAAGTAGAQDTPAPAIAPEAGASAAGDIARWGRFAEAARVTIDDAATPTPDLEAMREELVRQRSEALAAEQVLGEAVAAATARLNALGPPPAEGAEEAPELAERRRVLTEEVNRAQIPLVESREAYQEADELIRAIDRIVRNRFAETLLARGPSPLVPHNWAIAGRDTLRYFGAIRQDYADAFADPVRRAAIFERLPLNMLLVTLGLAVTFSLRRRLSTWVEDALSAGPSARALPWLILLRNVGRLIVPAVGAGLLFAALDPAELTGASANATFFRLPGFVLAVIAAGWIGNSLFAPRLAAYRLVRLDDAESRRGARLALSLGILVGAHLLLERIIAASDTRAETVSVVYFPLIVLGALALARAAGLLRRIRQGMEAHEAAHPLQPQASHLGQGFLKLLGRVLILFAVVAPLHAAVGYFAAARYMIFPTIMTLGLIATGVVLFDLINKTVQSFVGVTKPRPVDIQGGLIPVAVGALIAFAGAPLLALIWGARPSDIADVWVLLRDGMTLGGIRISGSIILTFIAVFAVVVAITRLLQSILRSTVLPRTRLDAGGKNAVLSGVGYVGFTVAALAAISTAGLDLSNLAIVAGALSVGIGFGLQNIVSNFVSGIILLVERPIKEGDWIEVGNYSGYVRGISVRSTEIETFDRASVILPNSDLVAGTVLNWTHSGMSGRMRLPIGVAYGTDPRLVERVLLEVAESHPMVLEDPAPRVFFMGFGPSSMDFEIRCHLRDVNFSLSAKSDMNYELVERFAREGIEIPFPQQDIRVRDADKLAAALRGGRRGRRSPGKARRRRRRRPPPRLDFPGDFLDMSHFRAAGRRGHVL
jgi:potassium-dependent mechanosensitive channel